MHRRKGDIIAAVVALAVLIVATLMALSDNVAQWEISVFRFVNDWPDFVFPIIWPFMQYGGFLTIPIVSAVAFYFKRKRLAIKLLGGGVGIYLAAIVIKNFVERGRPVDLLTGVNSREIFTGGSFGFTSGHAAVAATIVTYTLVYLPKRWRIASIAVLAIVAVGRLYVSAHFPLDIIGGAALGIAVASAINFIFGVSPDKKPAHQRAKSAEAGGKK
ncbi:phosphatase PAP2 family protein [Candidatus Saccharibacteria bacterium]|nr:phosphatase PAP2 family protein [Candidatus Saccharibacteria bacterium]